MRLPEDKVKRRQAVFKNIYRNLNQWFALIESIGPEKAVLTFDGEDVYFYDLMTGYRTLPPRQREAFDLHVLLGMSEGEAAKIMFPGSPWSTPVQQYAKTALIRMMEAYDKVQSGEARLEHERALKKEIEKKQARLAKRRREREEADRKARKNAENYCPEGEKGQAIRPEEESYEYIQKLRRDLFG